MWLCLDDTVVWEPEYKRLPRERLNIPSLHMMGHAKYNKAWEPLSTHYHRCMEIVVILSGSQQYTVNDATYILHGGNMFITYPDEVHGNGEMPQNVCEFVWFQLDLNDSENFLGLSGDMGRFLYQRVSQCKKRTINVSFKDTDLILQAWEELCTGNEAGRALGYSYLLNFLVKYFCTEMPDGDNLEIPSDILRALDYIRRNLTADIGIADMAEACGLSASRFQVKFKEKMGITPLSYLNSLKIDLAKSLLQDGARPITEIAFELNFSSSNYFSFVFRQYTGYSPKEFRRLILQRSQSS